MWSTSDIMHELRSKVEIENVSEGLTCWQCFGTVLSETSIEEPEAAAVGWGGGIDRAGVSSAQGNNCGWCWFRDPRLETPLDSEASFRPIQFVRFIKPNLHLVDWIVDCLGWVSQPSDKLIAYTRVNCSFHIMIRKPKHIFEEFLFTVHHHYAFIQMSMALAWRFCFLWLSSLCCGVFCYAFAAPLVESDKEMNEQYYLLWRLERGVAEGSSEIPKGEAIPLEYNLAGLNAISFEKGCYVGQELVARTHHRGVIRKRLLPFKLVNESGAEVQKVASGSDIVDAMSVKKVGTVTIAIGCHGLGVLRLEEAFKSSNLTIHRQEDIKVVVIRPDWWPAEWTQDYERQTAKRLVSSVLGSWDHCKLST